MSSPLPPFKVKARIWLMDPIHCRKAVTKCSGFRCSNWTKQIPLRREFSMASIILVIVLTLSALGGALLMPYRIAFPGMPSTR